MIDARADVHLQLIADRAQAGVGVERNAPAAGLVQRPQTNRGW